MTAKHTSNLASLLYVYDLSDVDFLVESVLSLT